MAEFGADEWDLYDGLSEAFTRPRDPKAPTIVDGRTGDVIQASKKNATRGTSYQRPTEVIEHTGNAATKLQQVTNDEE